MQAHERVGLQPVTTDTVPPVDEGHLDVGAVDQRVREGHAHGPCAHDEVVGVDRARHTTTQAPGPDRVHHLWTSARADRVIAGMVRTSRSSAPRTGRESGR